MDKSHISETTLRPNPGSSAVDMLEAIRTLSSVSGALFGQAGLHGQLLQIEWAEEKSRLLKMFLIGLLGFACLLSAILFVGVLAMAITWETAYRIPVVFALIALNGLGTWLAWSRFSALSLLGDQAFAATREELAADVELLKSKL